MEATNRDQQIVDMLGENDTIESTLEVAEKFGITHVELDATLKSLDAEDYINLQNREISHVKLTKEGAGYAENGSPEYQVVKALKIGEATPSDQVQSDLGKSIFGVGKGKAIKNKWVKLAKKDLVRLVEDDQIVDTDADLLKKIREVDLLEAYDEQEISALKKRKCVTVIVTKFYRVTKGFNYRAQRIKLEADITDDMIRTKSWKKLNFKNMNPTSLGLPTNSGKLHPLLKVRSLMKENLIGMGFEEMDTRQFVESSFWNFDTLFQP